MPQYLIDLDISAEQLLRYYRGAASTVAVRARDGRNIRFPVTALRPFVGHGGVRGSFVIEVDADNRMRELRRL